MHAVTFRRICAFTGLFGLLAPLSSSFAAEQQSAARGGVEEIRITARQREETLQDVPVTVAVIGAEDLNRYNITTLTDASKLVPNFQVFQGGSGNGSSIILRGIGSSSISAAFDQSVAINIDGVVVNIGRFIHNAYMDMGQIEVLKGPQSLYFGKSATAGVISITSKDPGDEFEATAMAGYEPEYSQTYAEAVVSSPINDTLGARLAIGYTDSDKLFQNLAVSGPAYPFVRPDVAQTANVDRTVKHKWRGEESLNTRLTLLWEPRDDVTAKLKYSYTNYENNGANGRTEEYCPEGHVQPTSILGQSEILPGVDDCKLNGNTSIYDLHPNLRAGLPYGGDTGVPFLKQDTNFLSGKVDWQINDQYTLTSVSGWVDLEHKELDIYDYNAGVFGGLHRNTYESLSQEFRLASDYDYPVNFMLGAYYQDYEQEFNAYQYAANIGMIAADPVTGKAYDYNKNHFLDGTVASAFLALYWDITEQLQVTAGARYTDEEKDGHITIPYVHTFLQGTFNAPPRIDGLKFDDDNTSPEVAVNYYVTPEISVYASYKKGYKSGGIDNSALPTNSLNASNPDFPDFLYYDSETAEGYEAGAKGNFLDGALRVDATIFTYEYSDLQVQLFDANAIQYKTFNASQLTTEGGEVNGTWMTSVDGLSLRGALALTDTEYTEDFINATGQNLKGEKGPLSADVAGFVGFTYDRPIFHDTWRGSFSFDARYNDGYPLQATLDPIEQSSFWLLDGNVRVYSPDEKYEVALIVRNLLDEIYAQGAGARPGACTAYNPNAAPGARCQDLGANMQDQVVTTSLGVEYQFLVRVRF